MKYLFVIALLLVSANSLSEIFKWADENGRVHYGDSDNLPENVRSEKMDIEINTYTDTSFEEAGEVTDKVVMYSTAWCGHCKKARQYFIANRIPFVEYDVDKDFSAKQRYQKLGARGVPVILYKERRMNGFSEAGFKRIYHGG